MKKAKKKKKPSRKRGAKLDGFTAFVMAKARSDSEGGGSFHPIIRT